MAERKAQPVKALSSDDFMIRMSEAATENNEAQKKLLEARSSYCGILEQTIESEKKLRIAQQNFHESVINDARFQLAVAIEELKKHGVDFQKVLTSKVSAQNKGEQSEAAAAPVKSNKSASKVRVSHPVDPDSGVAEHPAKLLLRSDD